MPAVDLISRTDPAGSDRTVRLREWATAALRDIAYAGAVFVCSVAAFCILVTGVAVTASLLVLVIGLFVWVAFVHVLRWTTWVDRRLAGWQRGEPVPAHYRRSSNDGIGSMLRTVSGDPQTWRDLAWLALNSFVGFVFGLAVITSSALVAGYVTMPLWYWAVSDPQAQYGVTNLGAFTVDSLGEAIVTAGIGLALLPVALLLARGAADGHAGIAARILGPSSDSND